MNRDPAFWLDGMGIERGGCCPNETRGACGLVGPGGANSAWWGLMGPGETFGQKYRIKKNKL